MKTEYVIAIIGLFPTVATAVIGWYYEHNDEAKRAKEIKNLQERLELVEKLNLKLTQNVQLKSRYKAILDQELRDILDDFEMIREIQQPVQVQEELKGEKEIVKEVKKKKPGTAKAKFWDRIWLNNIHLSFGGKMLKWVFRISSIISVIGGISVVYNVVSGGDNATFVNSEGDLVQTWPYLLFGLGFYVYIGWLARKAALRIHDKNMAKIKVKSK